MRLAGALVAACVAFAGMAAPAMAWTLLGTRDVADHTDHDVIDMGGPRRWNEIKLCVSRNPVHFFNLNVEFQNGRRQDIAVRSLIAPRTCTRNIPLRGFNRGIARISMVYEETSWHGGAATVRVFGQ